MNFYPKVTDVDETIISDPRNAQKYCNFIVFSPTSTPKDLVLKEQNLRTETKSGTLSSFRQVFEGGERSLVIKQFLYDWAPPAYDYPSLWRNAKIATAQESPPPRGIFIGNHVLWIGKNYRKQNAATIELERTRIEMTLQKGDFSDQELVTLCEGLGFVDEGVRNSILNTPFTTLSHYARHSATATRVPTGYWEHQRNESMYCYSLSKTQENKEVEKFPRILKAVLEKEGYVFNSLFAFGQSENQFSEIEFIFEHQKVPGLFIRLLTAPLVTSNPILFPPTIGDQECKAVIVQKNKGKQPFYCATSKIFDFGPHEVVFKMGDTPFIMLVKPAPWTSFHWLLQFMDAIE